MDLYVWELSSVLLRLTTALGLLSHQKQQRQVNEKAESKMELQTGNGTSVNGTTVKWNNSNKMEQQ